MSDIVERLRGSTWLSRTNSTTPDGTQWETINPWSEVPHEAADTIERLRTVMVAAAEEIAAHWEAHCDAEGYGPANLQRRLECGIPSQYGYTAGAFAELKAENERLLAAIAAPPEWQPIETAPQKRCFLAVVDGIVRLVSWGKTSHVPMFGWCFADQGPEDFDLCTPTHWMPLPAAPGAPDAPTKEKP